MHKLLLIVCIAAATQGSAQTVSRPALNLASAKEIVASAEAEARKRKMEVTIAVLDPAGQPIVMHRMDGAALATVAVAMGKARTAATWGVPSSQFEQWLGDGGQRLLSLPETVLIEGGVPISWAGATVGAIGVSGGASKDDAAVADAGIAALKRQGAPGQ